MITADVHLGEVWVMTLRPMSLYHAVAPGRTKCRIPLLGFGFTRPLADIQNNHGRPCPQCFPRRIRRDRDE